MARGRLEPPNLDDRTWQQLVDQAKALIPKYAPEWTDHNPSDLGITLIELFAWMTEQLIYQLNRVPEKTYLHLLNLVGIERRPAVPARVILAFQPNGNTVVELRKGSQFATSQKEDAEAVVFELDEDLTVIPDDPIVASREKSNGEFIYRDLSSNILWKPNRNGEVTGEQLSITGETSRLAIGFPTASPPKSPGIGFSLKNTPASVKWTATLKYKSGDGDDDASWTPLAQDELMEGTEGLHQSGCIRITLRDASSWGKTKLKVGSEEREAFWLSIDIAFPNDQSSGTSDIARLYTNAALATNALTTRETLGKSSGEANQVFELSRPIFMNDGSRDPYHHLIVETVGLAAPENNHTQWTRVEEHADIDVGKYWLDPATGKIVLGAFPDRTASSSGGRGSQDEAYEVRATYRYVAGGASGKVQPHSITILRSPNAGAVTVTNPEPAFGGKDEESVEDAKRRGPEALRTRNRAITARDVEYLAKQALPGIAKVRCLPPRLFTAEDVDQRFALDDDVGKPWRYAGIDRSPGRVNVIVVPGQGEVLDDTKRALVRRYITERGSVASIVDVHEPKHVAVKITVNGKVWRRADQSRVEERVKEEITQFLDSWTGNKTGAGWEIGEQFYVSDLLDSLRDSIPPSDGYITGVQASGASEYDEVLWVKLSSFNDADPNVLQWFAGMAKESIREMKDHKPITLSAQQSNGTPRKLIKNGSVLEVYVRRPPSLTKYSSDENAFRVAIADFELVHNSNEGHYVTFQPV